MADWAIEMRLPVFEIIIFMGEQLPMMVAACAVLVCIVRKPLRKWVIITPWLLLIAFACFTYWDSRSMAEQQGYDLSQPSLREAVEAYIDTGKGDLDFIINGKKYPPVLGKYEYGRFFISFLPNAWSHTTSQDADFLPEAYNKGDDWFEHFLGEPMVYTGALYANETDTMWGAQLNKLDFIAHAIGVKPGDKAMDIGCGWGRLSNHLASKGADVLGVTMASDQQAYGQKMTAKLGNEKKVNITLMNFFDLDVPEKSFNVITSVEMAEHVGIRNYGKFLRKVHRLLADDGAFYLQVAGLPRGYGQQLNHYENLIWGMFMDQNVFPGADASCPMGWVVTHLEQAGFEVQNVAMMGNHYSRTLAHWQKLWEAKKEAIVAVYGERAWRRWRVFLAWSVRIARQGSSSVQFITATKMGNVAARIAAQDRLAPGSFQLPESSPCPGGGAEPTEGF